MAELNPQRSKFKEAYCNPESETFGNAYRSALVAGFSDEYAKTITTPTQGVEWVSEILRDFQMLSTAEKVLKETLEMNTEDDVGKLRVKQDSAKFIAKTLGRHKYSERTETDITSGGKPIPSPILNALSGNDGHKEDPRPEKENQSHPGRDLGLQDDLHPPRTD